MITSKSRDPCEGHPCDTCSACRQGTCCGRDRPDYRLPDLGEWEGPIHGELGRLAMDEEGRLQCHVCGRFFRHLGSHAWHRHALLADEYRAAHLFHRVRARAPPGKWSAIERPGTSRGR